MTNYAPALDLTKYIEAKWFDDRPHIRGRRVPVWVIAYAAHTNDYNVKELAYDYTLTEAEIFAALLYYEEHKEQIDAQEAAINEKYLQFYE